MMNDRKDVPVQDDIAKRLAGLSPEKRMLLEKHLRKDNPSVPSVVQEPIAIIGMACRFPGGANNPEDFWKILSEGQDAISEITEERWRSSILDRRNLEPDELALLRWGGFLDSVDKFDPAFFDISPREAATMDPQQRIALEVAWEALESAGQPWQVLNGSDTGIFMGLHSQSSDYYWLQLNAPGELDTHAATGGAHSIAASRLSYFLDLRGPSMAVDTACSSSLVAVHLACQSLRSRECSMALAGGVNLILSPENSYAFSKLQFLSPDGRCKTFDAGANGYVRGEGCGVIVLRRLKDAVEAGDPIMAIIRGSAVNQDGATNGLTAPNGLSQQTVVQRALKNAGVEPDKITFVETHGTGTALGDPIEVESLIAVMSGKPSDEQICYLGAVKSYIGHLEAAAGIAGVIKAVLCMQQKSIPANLHFTKLNPHISLQDTRFRIPTETQKWIAKEGERFAGVSSFGFGGTNSHVVLQEAPKLPGSNHSGEGIEGEASRDFLLPLSARSDGALAALVGIWQGYLANNDPFSPSLQDICYTASVRRTHHGRRFAVTGRGREDLLERLKAYNNSHTAVSPGADAQEGQSGTKGLVFVFSGQGPQWFGMGRQLLEQEPVYREMIEHCNSLLEGYASWSLLDELRADESVSRVNQTEIAQPALFALQMGLAALWRSWGIEPDAVVGHSVGEVAAACFSGVLSLEDAVRVVYHRGRLLQRATGQGCMAAADISQEEAERLIADYQGRLTVAAINSPMSVTLSGENDALEQVLGLLKKQNVFCRMLPVNYAFHSPQIEPFRQEMTQSAAGIETRPAATNVMSSVTGKPAENTDFGSEYWAENIRRPVRFAEAIDGLILKGNSAFLEIGPHPVLSLSISQCLSHRNLEGKVFPSLRRGKNDKTTLVETLGGLYTLGRDVNWNSLYAKKARVVQLPPYPWNRKPYWIQTAKASTGRVSKGADSFTTLPHFIAGHRIRSKALTDHVFEFCLSPHSISFLGDHIVFGEIVLPAPVLMEMCFSAASQAFGKEFRVLEDFRIHRGLLFPNQQEKTLQVILKSDPPNSALFEVLVLSDNRDESNSWDTLASGKIRTAGDIAPNEPGWQNIDPFKKIKNFSRDEIPGAAIYMKLGEKGVQLGPLFRSIESIWLFERESFAKIRLPDQLKSEQRNYRIHPVLMDGSLQLVMAGLLVASESTEINAPYLFVGLDNFQQYAPPGPIVFCRAELTNPGQSAQELISGDITLVDEKGACIAEIKGVCLKKATRDSFLASREQASETSIFQLAWYPSPLHAKAGDLLATSVMPSPVQIYEKLSGIEIGMPRTAEHDQANTLSDELDLLCTAGVVHCFRQLGWQMALGSLVARDKVAFKLGVADRHRRLFDRMMGILKEDGILKIEGVNWKVVQDFKVIDQEKALSDLIIRHPEHETELKLLGDCLRELPGILRGETEPMNLLFPGGSIDRAEKLYQDSPVFRNNNELAGKIASILRSFVPENRILNVLEIGAGTGGTTGHILPVFTGNRTKYVFTDVSNFFLDKIKKKFSNYPFLSYQLLDIEKNLSEQSIPQGRFDLVIASNVLHATADLKQTLRNTLQLITPDGLLLLIEGVRAARWIDMIFGLTSGWWLFSDTDLRTNHPLISRETWLDVLKELNFREPLILSDRKSGNKEIFEQAVILAQAPKAYQERPGAFDEKKTRINSEAKKDHWLVFCSNSPIGRNVYAALEERGIECTLIYPEQVCGCSPNGQRSVSAVQIEYFKRMISDLRKQGISQFSNALFLWGIDATRQADSIDDIEGAATFSCSSLACLVKTFLYSEEFTPPRIWIVTQGAHSLQNFEKPCLSQTPLWGMGRVLSAEHPDLWGGMIDLDPESGANEAVRNMLAQILSEDGENQVSFRSDQRYVPSLSLCGKFSHQSISFSQEKTYLITGGLGALGLKTALWMAEEGARKLILLGRTLLPERSLWAEIKSNNPHYSKISDIQRIESLGAVVQTASVDVANEDQMRSFLTKLSEDGWRPIHGVVHAAGVIRDQLLHQLDATSFRDVLRPKMIGAWLLDSLLGEDPLDFFILFSSLGSLLGQKGQASYASANAFLDAVASYRRAKGQPALCINWGPWAGAGLAVTVGANRTIQNLYAQGVESLSDSEATQAIGALLQGKITQGVVIGINWKKFQKAYKNGNKRQSLSRLAGKLQVMSAGQAKTDPEDEEIKIYDLLLAVERGPQRRSMMESHLSEVLAGVLKQDQSLINSEAPFSTMGLDSLMALEFKSRCEKSFRLALSATMAWNHPTIRSLSSYLSEKMGVPLDPEESNEGLKYGDRKIAEADLTSEKYGHGVLGRVDNLSDEEALNELLRKE